MSLGHGYDMALLPVGDPSGSRDEPPHSGRAERQPRHHNSPPRRRRNRRRHRHQPMSGPLPASFSPSSVGDAGPLIGDLSDPHQELENESAGFSRSPGSTSVARPSGGSATTPPIDAVREPLNLLPHGLFGARRRFPFGLDNTAAVYSAAIRAGMSVHEVRPGAPLSATESLVTGLTAPQDVDLVRAPVPRRYTLGTLRQQLEEERQGQFPNFYRDSLDSDDDSDDYDPTRECFHIDDDTADSGDHPANPLTVAVAPAAGRDGGAVRIREDPPPNPVEPPLPQDDDQAAQLAQVREMKAKLDEDRAHLNQLEHVLVRAHGPP